MIKPGSVCYLVGLPRTALNGRVVTVVLWDSPINEWRLDAQWLRAYISRQRYKTASAPSCCLVPINDPDEPVTTHTPEALTA